MRSPRWQHCSKSASSTMNASFCSPTNCFPRRRTDHHCRSVGLWQYGILDQLQPTVDHAILSCARDGDGWAILMRDLSPNLLGQVARETEIKFFLDTLATIHATFWEALQTEGEEQRTIILVTHSLERGLELCDRSLILARGKVVYEGTGQKPGPSELKEIYRNSTRAGV